MVKRIVALGLAGAMTVTMAVPSYAAPVPTATAVVKAAAPDVITDVRWGGGRWGGGRWGGGWGWGGWGAGAVLGGLALGLAASTAYGCGYPGYGYGYGYGDGYGGGC